MRYCLLLVSLSAGLAAAAELPQGPAVRQLEASAETPTGATPEDAVEAQSHWSDGAQARPAVAPVTVDSAPTTYPSAGATHTFSLEPPAKAILPPSPAESAKDYDGFTKGFAYGYSAVEWVPNLIANAVPALGTVVGGLLGIGLFPLGLLAGAVAGAVAWIAGLFG